MKNAIWKLKERTFAPLMLAYRELKAFKNMPHKAFSCRKIEKRQHKSMLEMSRQLLQKKCCEGTDKG